MKVTLDEERCAYNILLQRVSSPQQFKKLYEALNSSEIPLGLYGKRTGKALGIFVERQPGVCHARLPMVLPLEIAVGKTSTVCWWCADIYQAAKILINAVSDK